MIDDSEHLFILYAQQKLIENRKILEERASKAHEESKKKKELI